MIRALTLCLLTLIVGGCQDPTPAKIGTAYPFGKGTQGQLLQWGDAGTAGWQTIADITPPSGTGFTTVTNGVYNATALGIPAVAAVTTAENTSSTSYTDLSTPGPSVTLTTGTSVIVSVSFWANNTAANTNSGFGAVAVSGATTLSAGSNPMQLAGSAAVAANRVVPMSQVGVITGLTAGSNTFKLQYKCDGSGPWAFSQRYITVTPIN